MNIRACINEPNLKDLAMDILKYVDEINQTLNNFDNRFYDLSNYYQGKSYSDLKKFYEDVREKYPIVKNNLLSYSDDLIALIRKMNEGATTLGNLFEGFTEDAKKKAAQIDDNFLKGN